MNIGVIKVEFAQLTYYLQLIDNGKDQVGDLLQQFKLSFDTQSSHKSAFGERNLTFKSLEMQGLSSIVKIGTDSEFKNHQNKITVDAMVKMAIHRDLMFLQKLKLKNFKLKITYFKVLKFKFLNGHSS